MSAKIEVGQRVLVVPNDSRNKPSWHTVQKVGRKWADLDRGERFDMAELRTDGRGYSSDAVFLSEDEYAASLRLSAALNFLRRKVGGYSQQPVTTVENIEAALALLGYDAAEFRAALTPAEDDKAQSGMGG